MLKILFVAAFLLPTQVYAQSHAHHEPSSTIVLPTQAGQSAFAAIQEIEQMLEANPKTNWSKVNLEALRQHLIDMDSVTLRSHVISEPVENGMLFTVSGSDEIKGSIQRMLMAHAQTMSGIGQWQFIASSTVTGATLLTTVPAKDLEKLKGLGFIGVMSRGNHHQQHHLLLATGQNPHP